MCHVRFVVFVRPYGGKLSAWKGRDAMWTQTDGIARSRAHRWKLVVAVGVVALLATGATVPWNLPSQDPSDAMPSTNGYVYAMEQIGSVLYIGGAFSSVGSQPRQNLAAIDVTTGAVTSWNPGANREVWGLAAAPDGQSLYATGKFGRVDGAPHRKVAEIDLSGNVTTWTPRLDRGRGTTVAAAGNTVYVGGRFTTANGYSRAYLAALDATDGRTLTAFDARLDSQVWDLEIAPDGDLWAAGNFSTANGLSRRGVVELDPVSGTATAWRPPIGVSSRDLAFGPLADRVFVAGAGRGGRVMAFETAGSGALAWELHLDGDVQAIDTTQSQVFAGGHQGAWYGGAPPIDNTISLDPASGALTGWNVSVHGGKGAWAILATAEGLWVAGELDHVGGELHGGIAFFPG